MILVKFWLHISDAEQQRRFERRARDPLKRWKLTNEDERNRARRRDYELAVEDMLDLTDHEAASWIALPAESKRYARVRVLEETCRVLEEGMVDWGIELPELTALELQD
jgi:polyphosphate kinase 2 (PPK2 family)